MKIKNRAIVVMAVALMVSVMLTGCGRPERSMKQEEPTQPEVAQTVSEVPAASPETIPENQLPLETLPDISQADKAEWTEYADVVTPRVSAAGKGSAQNTATESIVPENKRPGYDAGGCYRLEGNPYVIAVFLDDDVSAWTEEKVLTYLDQLVKPGLAFIEESAAKWGKELKFGLGYYATYGHPDRPVKYNGVVETLMEGKTSKDILDQVARAIGFESREHMNERLQDYSGQDQIVYMILLNKGGRSYTCPYNYSEFSTTQRNRALEHTVIFTGFTDDSGDTASDCIAHEALHIFGAMDYYMPDSRQALARQFYPKDIMLCGMPDLEYFELNEATAYCVGWTDQIPEVMEQESWWQSDSD